MEQEEIEEKGLTIGDIFKVIFKRVWWVVGSVAAFVLIAVLLLQFWYNPSNRNYTVNYDIRYANQNGYYPDGTILNVSDSILLENLQAIKNESFVASESKKGKFDGVDVEKMSQNDDISFNTVYTKLTDESYETHCSISIKGKYFSNKEQAVAFIKSVAEYPIDKVLNIVKTSNYLVNLQSYDTAQTYSNKIADLSAQAEYIRGIYENIKSVMGADYMPFGATDGKTIDAYILELNTFIHNFDRGGLDNTVSANYYVSNPSMYVSNLQASIESKTHTIEQNENIVAKLKAERDEILASSDVKVIEAYDNKIASYTESNEIMRNEIKESVTTLCRMEKYLEENNPVRATINTIRSNLAAMGVEMAAPSTADASAVAAKKAFDDRLEDYRQKLEILTVGTDGNGGAKQMRVNMYESQSMVIYVNNKVKLEGGINIVLGAILGALVGFILAGVVICIIDLPKYKREKLAAENGAQEPAQPEEK